MTISTDIYFPSRENFFGRRVVFVDQQDNGGYGVPWQCLPPTVTIGVSVSDLTCLVVEPENPLCKCETKNFLVIRVSVGCIRLVTVPPTSSAPPTIHRTSKHQLTVTPSDGTGTRRTSGGATPQRSHRRRLTRKTSRYKWHPTQSRELQDKRTESHS